MRVHELAVATQIDAPQIWPQSILRHGSLAWLAYQIPRVAIATIPDIERALEELRTRLRWIRGAQLIRIMKGMKMLRAYNAIMILNALNSSKLSDAASTVGACSSDNSASTPEACCPHSCPIPAAENDVSPEGEDATWPAAEDAVRPEAEDTGKSPEAEDAVRPDAEDDARPECEDARGLYVSPKKSS